MLSFFEQPDVVAADLQYSEFKSHKAWTTNLFSLSLKVSAHTYSLSSEDKYSFIVLYLFLFVVCIRLCVKMPYKHLKICQKTLSTVCDNKLNLCSMLPTELKLTELRWLS